MNGPCSACGDGDTALEYHSHDDTLQLVQPPSYTLAEIEGLAHEYTEGLETTDCGKLSAQLTLSAFLAHLKKQEKEGV